ncbi:MULTISPECIES: hypothetical protein [Bacillus]|uniref:hypothetical protein n=1 Tax=Bacillus TaxID=1386 RepID=UPI0007FB3E59|nr:MULTISPECIES: hypothetical protein [Bacillus cereus group]MEC5303738.1 hypothetical protein [Bacillus thuringiensis]OBW55683.1 hypothetical protein A9987_26030 [Bacillus cereus]OPA39711.1 hypothetical protein BHL07_14645 [Bacillus cereus]PEC31839.1 hypothetical protein COM99_21575 [Bacillus cereus]PFV77848.1 hypothetical protein COL02_12350 [Bacillus thuringiensis]
MLFKRFCINKKKPMAVGSIKKQIQSQYITWGDYVEETIENQLLQKRVEKAVSSLKLISAQEADTCRKLDIDYVITILTNKPYGSMPF